MFVINICLYKAEFTYTNLKVTKHLISPYNYFNIINTEINFSIKPLEEYGNKY